MVEDAAKPVYFNIAMSDMLVLNCGTSISGPDGICFKGP
jgi:hypothetical protein